MIINIFLYFLLISKLLSYKLIHLEKIHIIEVLKLEFPILSDNTIIEHIDKILGEIAK